jgi:hypothetical protein
MTGYLLEFFAQKEVEREDLTWTCFRRLFDTDFVPDADPELSEQEADHLDLLESYHFPGCDREDCVHRDVILSEILWQRDPLTSLVNLFIEAPQAFSAAELAEWDPIPSPLPEMWYWSDDGFGDIERVLSPFEYESLSETSDGEF